MPWYKNRIIIHDTPKTVGFLGWAHYINAYLIIRLSSGTKFVVTTQKHLIVNTNILKEILQLKGIILSYIMNMDNSLYHLCLIYMFEVYVYHILTT